MPVHAPPGHTSYVPSTLDGVVQTARPPVGNGTPRLVDNTHWPMYSKSQTSVDSFEKYGLLSGPTPAHL